MHDLDQLTLLGVGYWRRIFGWKRGRSFTESELVARISQIEPAVNETNIQEMLPGLKERRFSKDNPFPGSYWQLTEVDSDGEARYCLVERSYQQQAL